TDKLYRVPAVTESNLLSLGPQPLVPVVTVANDPPAWGGDFHRCSSESPLSLADGVWNVLKRCHRVQPKYRVGLGSFCSGSGRESLFSIGIGCS
ncbi:hypothetical protein PIB30_087031, partial [Stylosanthes scabra]|nr:hypothetical protein [Stylosanthes scabra]